MSEHDLSALRRRARQRAFTLVELLGVLIIIAILAFFALPRFFDRKLYDAREFFDQTKSMVRYGQKLAIAGNRPVYVRLNGSSVALCFDIACTRPVAPPAGNNSDSAATLAACSGNANWFCEAVPAGISYTALDSANKSYAGTTPSFFFSPLGKPFNATDTSAVSGFTRPLTVSVTGDGITRSFVIEPETGYVHL